MTFLAHLIFGITWGIISSRLGIIWTEPAFWVGIIGGNAIILLLSNK